MDQTTHEVRLANWAAIIQDCQSRPKGQTARQWLEEHDVPEKQYYYWLRKVRQNKFAEIKRDLPIPKVPQLPSQALVEIPAESIMSGAEIVPAVTIRTKKSTIMISSAVSEAMMVRLVKAMSHAL